MLKELMHTTPCCTPQHNTVGPEQLAAYMYIWYRQVLATAPKPMLGYGMPAQGRVAHHA